MSQVDRAKRQKAFDQISSAANQLLKELNVQVEIREPLMVFFVHGHIKRFLAL